MNGRRTKQFSRLCQDMPIGFHLERTLSGAVGIHVINLPRKLRKAFQKGGVKALERAISEYQDLAAMVKEKWPSAYVKATNGLRHQVVKPPKKGKWKS